MARLHVVIAGAGIAGLSAAVSIRRAGHIVTIYERSALNNEIGAAITVPPNASRNLLRWGLDPVAERFVLARGVAQCAPRDDEGEGEASRRCGGRHASLREVHWVPMGEGVARKYGSPFYFAHRVDLHRALKRMATQVEGVGTPVKIYTRAPVVGYDPEAPSITLANGQLIRADVVIAADGVHSQAAEVVLGAPNPPQAQEHCNSCYRFLIPVSVVRSDPETAFFAEDFEGKLRIFADNVKGRRLVCYPCRNNEILNFVAMVPNADMKCVQREDWSASASMSQMLDIFKDFDPRLLKVMSKATDLKAWPLLFRPPIPTWRKGRMVLAGDAAHPMLPHQGQGGAQGLEDGVALGIALSGHVTRDSVPERLAAYERVRIGRASAMQILSNAGQDQVQQIHKEAARYIGSEDAVPKNPAQFAEFNFGHDVAEATRRCLAELDPNFDLPDTFFQRAGPFLP